MSDQVRSIYQSVIDEVMSASAPRADRYAISSSLEKNQPLGRFKAAWELKLRREFGKGLIFNLLFLNSIA